VEVGDGYAFNQTCSKGFDAHDEQAVGRIANTSFAFQVVRD
jgi:hypothetical protein